MGRPLEPGAAGVDMQGFALLANVVRKVNTAPRGRLRTAIAAHPKPGLTCPLSATRRRSTPRCSAIRASP